MLRKKLLFLTPLLIAQPAHADWQSAKWGSSPEAVTKAMAPKFPVSAPKSIQPNQEDKTYLLGHYRTGPAQFEVSYEFTSGKLSAVHLALQAGLTCTALINDLTGKYGVPAELTTGIPTERVWHDKSRNNRMTVVSYNPTFCTLSYEPLKSSAADGL